MGLSGRVLRVHVKPSTPGEPGLPKRAVPSARLTAEGFDGDFNRYRQESKAGSPGMAVLLMPAETLTELRALGWPIQPGDIGENITTEGLAYAGFAVGRRFKVGGAALEISEPCAPCKTLGHLPFVGKEKITEFTKVMLGRRGWYARVIEEGLVSEGDAITCLRS